MRSIRDFKFLFEIRTSNVCLRMNNKIAASQMMTCGYFVWSVSVVPLGSLHVPMGRSTCHRSVAPDAGESKSGGHCDTAHAGGLWIWVDCGSDGQKTDVKSVKQLNTGRR